MDIIRLLDGAKEDLRNGWFFYERQAPGLGDRFLGAIEADVRQLPAYAGIHPGVEGFHRLLIKRFPFALYYRVEESSVDIYAVLDCRRDPNWIQERKYTGRCSCHEHEKPGRIKSNARTP